ncbi:MAG: nuclear transport factor 2 family protein [Myxococcota bacterium]|nr:nuclear transport factor 2 family protein [Myxococcota bacterium]
MSLYKKWSDAFNAGDMNTLAECLHDDFTFVRHQSNTKMNKQEMLAMAKVFAESDAVTIHSQRCVYENNEIVVEHTVMDFPDGTREAVLGSTLLKDGLMYHTETGATKLDK